MYQGGNSVLALEERKGHDKQDEIEDIEEGMRLNDCIDYFQLQTIHS